MSVSVECSMQWSWECVCKMYICSGHVNMCFFRMKKSSGHVNLCFSTQCACKCVIVRSASWQKASECVSL